MTPNKTTYDEDCCDAVLFVDSHLSAQLTAKDRRDGIVARWVQARREGKDAREARRTALVGMPIWAAILAHVLFKILVRWWKKRNINGLSQDS